MARRPIGTSGAPTQSGAAGTSAPGGLLSVPQPLPYETFGPVTRQALKELKTLLASGDPELKAIVKSLAS
jgi:hypothetical protein